MPPIILENNCNGCGLCDLLCPVDIIFMEKKSNFHRPCSASRG